MITGKMFMYARMEVHEYSCNWTWTFIPLAAFYVVEKIEFWTWKLLYQPCMLSTLAGLGELCYGVKVALLLFQYGVGSMSVQEKSTLFSDEGVSTFSYNFNTNIDYLSASIIFSECRVPLCLSFNCGFFYYPNKLQWFCTYVPKSITPNSSLNSSVSWVKNILLP